MIKRIITLSLLSSAFAFGQQAPAPGTVPPGQPSYRADAPVPGQPYPAATAPGQPYPTAAPVPGQPYPAAPVPGQPYTAAPVPGQPYPAAAPVPGQPYPADAPFPGEPHDGHDHQEEVGTVVNAEPGVIMVRTEPDGDIVEVKTDDYSEIVFITSYDELDQGDFQELKGKRVMVVIGQRPDGSSAVDHIDVHDGHDDHGDEPHEDYPPAIDPATGSAPIPPG
ncbi:MAG: hypothetical protein CBC16_08020 [Verrucomicrobia bacterium TMED56]|nr:MAG: hypothetical protein CBC16_08020 [Verrucomicrobia bacterium TMED56]